MGHGTTVVKPRPENVFTRNTGIDVDGEITDLPVVMERYRDLKIEFAPSLEAIKFLEKKIRVHIKDTGETVAIDGARSKFTKGYSGPALKAKDLLAAIATDPESDLAKAVAPYVYTKTVSPGLKLEID